MYHDWIDRRIASVNSIYDLMGTEVLTGASAEKVASALDMSTATMSRFRAELAAHGILKCTFHQLVGGGRTADWQLIVPREDAIRILREVWEKHGGSVPVREVRSVLRAEAPKEEKVTLATSPKETTLAIAGPDDVSAFEGLRPLRKSEPHALVEATRQYAMRTRTVEQKLDELEALGIHIDRSAVKVDIDPEMEAIAKVLPYISELEGRVNSYEKTVASLQEQVRGGPELRATVNKQKAQIERLIAEKVSRAS